MTTADPPSSPSASPPSRLTYPLLNATVFIAAGCVMTVEILSTRLVARYLGASLYTWTSAIGVVLAGISVGNYVGGRLADRCADRVAARRTLSVLFLAASVACMTIPMVNGWIGQWSVLTSLTWPPRIFWHFVLVFLLPSTLLGTMSPVVAKMALDMGHGPGRTIGTIYAWGAVGSIVGTFVAGFFLVAWMGTERAIIVVSGVLAVMGVLYAYKSWIPWSWTAVWALAMVCALGPWAWTEPVAAALGLRDPDTDHLVFMEDSQYQRVLVMDYGDGEREMVLDLLVHSVVNMADPLDLKYEYETIYAEVMRRYAPGETPVSALFLGGGGYVFPRYVELTHPGSHVEVAEIDPVVTRAAFEAFGLPETTAIECFDQDARQRVADLVDRKHAGEPVPAFDLVFGDAFSDYSVPYHLTTVEFIEQLDELMTHDGVYMLNLIDALASGRFLAAVVSTCREVFPHVSVYGVGEPRDTTNTYIVVSSRRQVSHADLCADVELRHGFPCHPLDDAYLDDLITRTGNIVLIDDYAPVENLLAPVVRTRRSVPRHVDNGVAELQALYDQGRLDEVITRCRAIIDDDPRASQAHFWLATTLLRQDRPTEAIDAFRAELALDASRAETHARLGVALELTGDDRGAETAYRAALAIDPRDAVTRCDLGRVLKGMGREHEAMIEYREAIRLRPGLARAHASLGTLLQERGDAVGAIPPLEEALRLDPEDEDARLALVRVLLDAGRPRDAAGRLADASSPDLEHGKLSNTVGQTLAARGDVNAAVEAFARAVALVPDSATYRANLGLACQQAGRVAEAVGHYRESLRLQGDNGQLMYVLARLLATSPDDAVRNGPEAVQWAERLVQLAGPTSVEALDTLAAAYAETGRFDEAATTVNRAIEIADASGRADVTELRRRLSLYEGRYPYRESVSPSR